MKLMENLIFQVTFLLQYFYGKKHVLQYRTYFILFQVENIKACLNHVERLGVTLDGISSKDIRDGNLKSILGLFFALSKHKQQQKQLAAERDKIQRLNDMHSRLDLPIPFCITYPKNLSLMHFCVFMSYSICFFFYDNLFIILIQFR